MTLEGSDHSWPEFQQCAPGTTVQQHPPGTIAEFSDLCILPEVRKSLLYVSSPATLKKGNCRQVKKKQVKRTDGPEILWGETQTLKCLKAKHFLNTAKTYLSIGPSLQGRWYVSAGPWDFDTLSEQPLDAPRQPCPGTQQCTGASSGMQLSHRCGLGWAGLANSSCSKETVALGVTVGNTVQQVPPENS